MRTLFKSHLTLAFAACVLITSGRAQTPVLFPLAEMTGQTNDTTLTVRPIYNPVHWNHKIYWLPYSGIQLTTVNGSVTTNLIPNDYFVTVNGASGSWKISVPDTNVVLNAAEIGTLTVYTFSQVLPGVNRIIAGSGASVSPTSGQGDVIVSLIGGTGSGTGNVTGTNTTVIGNLVVWAALDGTFIGDAGLPLSSLVFQVAFQNFTNSVKSAAFHLATDFDTAGSATAATNGWPWSPLYDAAGTARNATNGYPWGTLYDAANSAHNATNGYPWGSLYDVSGAGTTAATAATNGYPWGSLYDAANSARNATNGYPWGSLYDAANSAHNATNGFPWGSLYDAAGAATAATNGWPWGILYDSVNSARNATNGYPWGPLYASPTNIVTWWNPGSTNISVVFSNNLQTVTLTNAPKDVFFTFSVASGCNSGSFAALCPTNTTIHVPYPIKWFAGMSNSVVTNGTIEFDCYGGTNFGQLWGGIGEGM